MISNNVIISTVESEHVEPTPIEEIFLFITSLEFEELV